jgi:rhodanese-related sulfurtransferase
MTQYIVPRALYDVLQKQDHDRSICVDVRTEAEHDRERIAGSINIPLDQLRSHLNDIKGYEAVYVYCASGNRSAMACEILQENGFHNLYDLQDGVNRWKLDQLPTVGAGKNRIPLMQQVLIVVGTVVLGSIIASYFISDFFLILPFGMSIGLLYAGFSGNCLMTKILIKMPWNQTR